MAFIQIRRGLIQLKLEGRGHPVWPSGYRKLRRETLALLALECTYFESRLEVR